MSPPSQILARAAEWDAHLIVLGRHKLHRFDRLVLGSVSSTVVRRAPISVLVVPTTAVSCEEPLERTEVAEMSYFG